MYALGMFCNFAGDQLPLPAGENWHMLLYVLISLLPVKHIEHNKNIPVAGSFIACCETTAIQMGLCIYSTWWLNQFFPLF